MMIIFFYKQKTAYEMRISDWSSDVCSSDLDIRFECEMIDRASQYKPAQCLITRHTSNDEIAFRTGGRPEYDFDRVACLDMDVDVQPLSFVYQVLIKTIANPTDRVSRSPPGRNIVD